MIKYYNELEQGTDEWFQVRLGVITASNINILLTPTGKPAKGQKVESYAYELAAQRELAKVEDSFQSFDMMRGHIQEGIARDLYSENYAEVRECGFITNDDSGVMLGCSPDGLVFDDGGIEIKSRKAKFQIQTVIADEVPAEYVNQIQTFLLVSGREWCDFVQYSNGMPLFVKRVYSDPVRQAAILEAVTLLEGMICRILAEYREKSANLIPAEYIDFMADQMIEPSEVE